MRTREGLFYAFLSTLMCIPGPLFAMQREGTPLALSLPAAAQLSQPPIVRGPPRNPPSLGLPTRPRQPSLSRLPLARSDMILASPDSVTYAAPTRTLSRSAP
jgi:hypothetical protein